MFKALIQKIFGDPNKKVMQGLLPTVSAVASYEDKLKALSDDEIRAYTADLRSRVQEIAADVAEADETTAFNTIEDALEDVLPEAYALVREASRRANGLRHYDVQIMGGILLNQAHIVEMKTGEGKTLVATLPLFLNALAGKGVHLVTVNEYLARRDGGWMGKIFHQLGLTVGCIGPQQFSALYDPEYVNPGSELEDERLVHWRPSTRRDAYRADVTYGISSEFGFDYLRDNMVQDERLLVQRDLHFAVIDEADNVLIDEARTPLIISGPANQASEEYGRFASLVRGLRRNTVEDEDEEPNGHYDIDEKARSIVLTDMGVAEIEKRITEIDVAAGESLYDPQYYHLTYYLENALKAEYLFKKNVDYVVQEGEVIIVDDFTGRLMPGRRYSDGLHEAIEAKEGVNVQRESVTVATITIQNYFRLYRKVAGMTGTAMTDAEEFQKIYEVEVTPLPTNVTYMAEYANQGLEVKKGKMEGFEQIAYYKKGDNEPSYFKRVDFPDQVFATQEIKDSAIVQEVKRVHEMGRPILVGTTSVEHSEKIHRMLEKEGIKHHVLNAKRNQSEALIVSQAGRKGAVTISTNMAGRGTDILLGGNPEGLAAEFVEDHLFSRPLLTQLAQNLVDNGEDSARQFASKTYKLSPDLVTKLLAVKVEYDQAAEEISKLQVVGYLIHHFQTAYNLSYEHAQKMVSFVQVNRLNAAREFLKSVEKDTVMVDEATRLLNLHQKYQAALQDQGKMAEFLAEQVFEQHYTARAALVRAVLANNLTYAQELVSTIPALPAKLIEDIQNLMRQSEAEKREVWQLGGLHVIGSERHESRRIDNQLRGRAARQGDPGSSRFFLSLEDDLMRRFGGERLKSFMGRYAPDDLPIENRILDGLIASSQERIEGYNFDVRKNVLEYDDVMAKQRESIYKERRQILTGKLSMEEKVDEGFELVIDEIVTNYLDNYLTYIQGEAERTIADFSAESENLRNTVNVRAVLRRMRGWLPVHELDEEELDGCSPDELLGVLMDLARENLETGRNLLQLLQAMGRFIPVLPAIPNLEARLLVVKVNHLQARAHEEAQFVAQLKHIFDGFLSQYIEPENRDNIWNRAMDKTKKAFEEFNVQRPTKEIFAQQQIRFRETVSTAVQELLVESLNELNSDELVEALNGYVGKERIAWQARIGEEEYTNYQRLLILSAIDREWRDYLTAADDLRREIGLEAATRQRDPKIEYKKRSYEMFSDMKNNIRKDIANRFFREIIRHEEFRRQQQAQANQQVRLNQAGLQVVEKKQGKGVEVRRELPKVGRNDLCPCGSGKKYKHCHGKN